MFLQNLFEKILYLNDFFKFVISLIVWCLIFGGLYFIVIQPQYQEISKKKNELNKLKIQSLKIIKVKKKLNKFKKEFAEINKKFKLALKKLPDSKEIPKLLLKISNYGKENDLDFIFFKPGKEIKKDFYAIIPINLRFSGYYIQTGNFFYEIGKMTRIVKIKNFKIKKRKDNLLEINSVLETYKFLGNKSLKNVAKKRKK